LYPAQRRRKKILALNPDGVFLSNGPGDPEPLTYAIETIRGLLGKKPDFRDLPWPATAGLAFGGKTYKLRSDIVAPISRC
jgi:carbamoyl-phosphate synthase small subunit